MKTIDYYNQYADEFTQATIHADSICNFKKSNLLASDKFLRKWQERNEEQDLIIVDRISMLGLLTDKE